MAAFFIIEIDDMTEIKVFKEISITLGMNSDLQSDYTVEYSPRDVNELFETFEKLKRASEENLKINEDFPNRKSALVSKEEDITASESGHSGMITTEYEKSKVMASGEIEVKRR